MAVVEAAAQAGVGVGGGSRRFPSLDDFETEVE